MYLRANKIIDDEQEWHTVLCHDYKEQNLRRKVLYETKQMFVISS